jgi:hypothetical protein
MREKTIRVLEVVLGILCGIVIALLVLHFKSDSNVKSYTYNGEAITSEYKVVGTPDDFELDFQNSELVLKWNANGKYDFSYCYVIPPLSEFEEKIAEELTRNKFMHEDKKIVVVQIGDFSFDANCKEVYFSDGCPPIIGNIGVEDCVATNAFISASVTSIGRVASNNVNYASQSHLAEVSAYEDDNTKTRFQPTEEIDFPDNIYEVSNLSYLGSLKNINFPKNVKNLNNALTDCSKIEKCEISSEELEGIYTSFNDCDSLTEVAITGKAKVIDSSFNRCLRLELVRIPDETVIVGDSFLGCRNLTLSVEKGSSAEAYAIANDIAYEYHTSD